RPAPADADPKAAARWPLPPGSAPLLARCLPAAFQIHSLTLRSPGLLRLGLDRRVADFRSTTIRALPGHLRFELGQAPQQDQSPGPRANGVRPRSIQIERPPVEQ